MTGKVLAVQESETGLDRLSIAHDEVPGFRDLETGEVVGMPAMTMPFPVAAGAPSVEAGDSIGFTLLVDGGDHGGLPYVIESIQTLGEAEIPGDR